MSNNYPTRTDTSYDEIISIPYSVRNQLQRAETLLDQGRDREALPLYKEAAQELARQRPELLGLIMGLAFGGTSLVLEDYETNINTVEREKRLLGVRVASESTTTTHSRTSRKRLSFE